MVSLGCQMQTTTSLLVVVIEICSFVLEQHVNDSRVPVPACILQRSPLSFSFDIWVCVFLEEQIVDHALVSNGTCKMQRCQLIISKGVQVNNDILG